MKYLHKIQDYSNSCGIKHRPFSQNGIGLNVLHPLGKTYKVHPSDLT